jgi:hypothetical protein
MTCRKLRLETGQMRAAVGIENVVAEAQHILMELIDILESDVDL